MIFVCWFIYWTLRLFILLCVSTFRKYKKRTKIRYFPPNGIELIRAKPVITTTVGEVPNSLQKSDDMLTFTRVEKKKKKKKKKEKKQQKNRAGNTQNNNIINNNEMNQRLIITEMNRENLLNSNESNEENYNNDNNDDLNDYSTRIDEIIQNNEEDLERNDNNNRELIGESETDDPTPYTNDDLNDDFEIENNRNNQIFNKNNINNRGYNNSNETNKSDYDKESYKQENKQKSKKELIFYEEDEPLFENYQPSKVIFSKGMFSDAYGNQSPSRPYSNDISYKQSFNIINNNNSYNNNNSSSSLKNEQKEIGGAYSNSYTDDNSYSNEIIENKDESGEDVLDLRTSSNSNIMNDYSNNGYTNYNNEEEEEGSYSNKIENKKKTNNAQNNNNNNNVNRINNNNNNNNNKNKRVQTNNEKKTKGKIGFALRDEEYDINTTEEETTIITQNSKQQNIQNQNFPQNKVVNYSHIMMNNSHVMKHLNRKGCPIDWNGEFQKLLSLSVETETQRLYKYSRLSALSADFVNTAKRCGKIIISEFSLKHEERTINPHLTIGGEAGGQKYIYHGILFKFARDWKKIYGSEELAQKAAGHELLGVMRFSQCKGLHVPLMALIDYRGYRLIAESILPVTDETIQYGSNNGGYTVLASNLQLNELMRKAGEQLNIKGHYGGKHPSNQQFIYGPTDIEGHRGTDGRYYVIDFARLFPPTAEKGVRDTYIYKLFRPEFIKNYPIALSSDAYSPFGKNNQLEHNKEVRVATNYLIENVIPDFADQLENLTYEIDVESQLTELVHRAGINIRYLGFIRRFLQQYLQSVVLLEMVARIIKNRIRAKLREKGLQLTTLADDLFRQVIISFLNVVLGHNLENAENREDMDADQFWKDIIKQDIQKNFHNALTEDELNLNYNLKENIDMYKLFKRLQQLIGVKLTKQALNELKQNPSSFCIVISDIKKISAKVKHMNIVSLAEANALSIMSMNTDKGSHRLFRLAMSKFETAIRAAPDNEDALNDYAEVLVQFAMKNLANMNNINYNNNINYSPLSDPSFTINSLTSSTGLHGSIGNNNNNIVNNILRRSNSNLSTNSGTNNIHQININNNNNNNNNVEELTSPVLLFRKAFEKYKMAKNWKGIIKLSKLLVEIQPSRSSQQKIILDLANECYRVICSDSTLFSPASIKLNSSMDAPPSPASSAIYKSMKANTDNLSSLLCESYINWGKLLIDQAKRFNNDNLYELAGLKFKEALKFPESQSTFEPWAHSLSTTELSVLWEFLLSSPSLTHIDTSHCFKKQFITSHLLLTITTNIMIKKLIFNNLHTNGDINSVITSQILCQIIKQSKKLEEISMNFQPLVDNHLISAIALNCSNLTSLSIKQSKKISYRSITSLFDGCTQLEYLNLSHCSESITDQIICNLAWKCPFITEIDLSYTNINNCSLTVIYQNFPHISSLNLANCKSILVNTSNHEITYLSNFTQLKKLNLSNCELQDFDIEGIVSSNGCSSLTHLNIAKNPFNPNSLNQIGFGCKKLKFLHVTRVLNQIASNIAIGCTDLEVLKLDNCRDISMNEYKVLFKNLRNLRKLRLRQCKMKTTPFLPQFELIKLESLDLSYSNNDIAEIVIEDIANYCPNLKKLLFKSVELTDNSITLLNKCKQLEVLKLSHSKSITDNAIRSIAFAFPNLRKLIMQNLKGITTLDEIANRCPHLRHLDLKDCHFVNTHSIIKILKCAPIVYLNIMGCKMITDDVIECIREDYCPTLTNFIVGSHKISTEKIEFLKQSSPQVAIQHHHQLKKEHSLELRIKKISKSAGGSRLKKF